MKGFKQLALMALFLLAFGNNVLYADVIELDKVAAVVNKDVIMASELNTRVIAVRIQLAEKNIPMPPESVLKEQILDLLILENIQLQWGEKLGIRDDWMRNDPVEDIARQQNLTVPEFIKKLEANGLTLASFREEIRKNRIIGRVRQRIVAERIHISEQEVDSFLKSQEGKSKMETEYRLSHILIATPENASSERIKMAKQQADVIADKLKKGANFSEMAITFSKGQNAFQGGDLGWRKASQLPTLFAEQALKMKKGQVSAPVRSPSGFHLFKLLDTKGNEKHVREQLNVRHILLKVNEVRPDLAVSMQAKKIYLRIQKGELFGELAKVYSEDSVSAVNGGDLGWVSSDDPGLPNAFKTVMNVISLKSVSEPFKTDHGWHILEVMGKRKADISEDVRRSQVRELLGNRKFEEELAVWLREIRDQAYVDIRIKW